MATQAQIPLSRRSRVAKPDCRSEAGQRINQNNLIMQNKPNFPAERTNASDVSTAGYKNMCLAEHPQNKPDTNPIQSQPNPI